MQLCSQLGSEIRTTSNWLHNFKNSPRLWLRKELIKYQKQIKFLGITFDEKLTFKPHIEDIVSRCKKRLNLLKAIRGTTWGAHPSTILYSYKVFIRPILEYGSILFAHCDKDLLKKIQAVETEAIKIAFRLPPWTTNHWCYSMVHFDKILDRIKELGKQFLDKNTEDPLIKPLIEAAKPSMNGKHSPVFKILNWWSMKISLQKIQTSDKYQFMFKIVMNC